MIPYQHEIEAYLSRNGFAKISPKAALIDMDGTLYNSMVNHTAAWHRMMDELGIPNKREEFYLYEGATGAWTINHLFQRGFGRDATTEEIEENYKKKTVYFQELPPVEVMPGALEMVRTFAEFEMKRVLVTGSGQNSLISRIPKDFPGLFSTELRITSRDVTHGKPNPEPFLRAMQLAGAEPWESVVMENAPLGVEAGHRAKAFTIGVTTGPIPAEARREAGADIVFPSMTECAAQLPALLNSMKSFS